MNYIIYDLEATCWDTYETNNKTQEIIEIGAVLVNEYAEVQSQFVKFIRPVVHPTLSVFCRRLTSIQQPDVNAAKEFPIVIEQFLDWIGYNDNDEYLLCSWGNFDKKAFIADSKLHRLPYEWTAPHINLKQQYQDLRRLQKPAGLKSAVEKEGFDFTGQHHRGISDAQNLAKLFIKFFEEWDY